jgi:hypothetical protein
MFESPDSANLWFDIFNGVLLTGAFLVAVGTWGTIKTASIKEKFSDERVSANELETKRAVADSDAAKEGTAKAHEAIAQANAQIAVANESAARANERAAELTIALKKRENRILTPEQRAAILERLKPLPDKGKVLVNALFGDAEAFQFSDQILSVLKDAGYAAEEVPQDARLISLNRTGLFLWMKDARNPPERAKNIATAFRLVGIEMLGDSDADITDSDTVVFVVSSHP